MGLATGLVAGVIPESPRDPPNTLATRWSSTCYNRAMASPTDPMIDLFMVEIVVADWRSATRWYVDVLGLRPAFEDVEGRFLLLQAGSGRVALKEGATPADHGAVRLVFQVEDVEASRERLIALGVEVGAISESAEGYREVRLADPEGTPIHLFAWVGREG